VFTRLTYGADVDELGWKRVDQWWAELLGVEDGDLWRPGVSIAAQAGLEDVDGLMVVRRKDGFHVSLPSWVAKVAEHGLARYRAEAEHERSQALGRTLGFEPYCEELTVR